MIDRWDIEDVFDQFRGNGPDGSPVAVTDGEANWGADPEEAGLSDLSADLTGDRVINVDDATGLVVTILETSFGDVNLDGFVDSADEMTVRSVLDGITVAADPSNPLFTEGDVNGEDVMHGTDLRVVQGLPSVECSGDTNADDSVNAADLLTVLGNFGETVSGRSGGDVAGSDNRVVASDLLVLLKNFGLERL